MKKILILISIILAGIGFYDVYQNRIGNVYAKSYGAILVNFHSTLPGNAIFDIHNFLPGDFIGKTIDIKNTGDKKTEVFVNADKRQGSTGNPKLESVLDIKITQGATTFYSNKLVNFFNEKNISLGELNKNQSKPYVFKVSFPATAGNEYQNKFVKFDLIFNDKSKSEVKGDHDEKHDDKKWFDNFLDKCKKIFKR